MARDYYLILGVSSDATLDEIKSAYRRQAKRWHPDRSGEGSEAFLVIREAYEVLGDAGRRRAYDDELARQKASSGPPAREPRSEPLRRGRPPAEPLVPDRAPFPTSSFSPLVDELDRLAQVGRPWSDLDAPPRRAPEPGREVVHLRVSLTPRQALHGGRLRISLPVRSLCPACDGRGTARWLNCPYCLGSGAIVDELPLDIAFPGGLAHGSIRRVSLQRPGAPDLQLVFHFSVDEW